MNLTQTIIPVYNMMACVGATDFAIMRLEPFHVLGKMQVPHRQEGYNFSLLLRGSITKYIDFERHVIEAPALIAMGPEQVHQYEEADDAEMVCISFSQDFLINEMRGWMMCWECMFGHVVIDIEEEAMRELTIYTRLMEEEFRNRKPKSEIIIRNLLNAFIVCSARMRNTTLPVMQMDATQSRLVLQFKIQVDANFRDKTQVSQYADMLYITPGHLNDVIKSTIGKTAKQVIDEKRIMEAKRLLFWGDLSLKEIADYLSFEDDSYFNRYFKKHTGHTPSLFQRTIREKYN
ncbi:MAG TPA: AraC family transcriptional regulator [Ohtaekwangia sp.]|uniref:helix-turn-helix domain-containing protein n=1 Tax=Ohtaekwangia sp. TaxID=2066019 RepID=UPI002F93A6A5